MGTCRAGGRRFEGGAAAISPDFSALGPGGAAWQFDRPFMTNVPSDLRYAKSHEWVRVAGTVATVGITDHAQHELTDIVFVELPAVGRVLKAGESCAVVESVKTASDIYSPVSGKIVAVNADVVSNPALANTEPYAGGWFYQVELAAPAEVEGLLTPAQYQAQIGG